MKLLIGESLKALRKKAGWTQKELAEKLHISYQTVSKWELNKSLPTLEMIVALSLLFNTSVDTILFPQKKQPAQETIWQKLGKLLQHEGTEETSVMKTYKKYINHQQTFQAILDNGGIVTCFLKNNELIPNDKSISWITSLEDSQFLTILNKNTKTVSKVSVEEIQTVTFALAKTFLGTAPGIFFTQKIILEITLTLKNQQHLALLSPAFQSLNQVWSYFEKTQIEMQDCLQLKEILATTSPEKLNEYLYDHYDALLKKAGIEDSQFYGNI